MVRGSESCLHRIDPTIDGDLSLGKIIEILLKNGVVMICGGGGGIPTFFAPNGELVGVEAVIDKDCVGALLAESANPGLR